jgi:hypothetical protein
MAVVTGTSSAYTSDTNKFLHTQRATGMPEITDNSSTLPITSTNIEVYSNGMRLGFVQSFTPSEQRTIKKVQELGTEGVVQSVPGNTNGGQIAISRFAIFNGNLYNALGLTPTGKFAKTEDQINNDATTYSATTNTLGNPFKTLKEQRVPLELQVKMRMPDMGANAYYIETYIDCWLSQYSKSIVTNDITVTESATIQYSDVYSSYTNVEE